MGLLSSASYRSRFQLRTALDSVASVTNTAIRRRKQSEALRQFGRKLTHLLHPRRTQLHSHPTALAPNCTPHRTCAQMMKAMGGMGGGAGGGMPDMAEMMAKMGGGAGGPGAPGGTFLPPMRSSLFLRFEFESIGACFSVYSLGTLQRQCGGPVHRCRPRCLHLSVSHSPALCLPLPRSFTCAGATWWCRLPGTRSGTVNFWFCQLRRCADLQICAVGLTL